MARQALQKIWQFATNYELLKLGKPGQVVEAGALVSKAFLDLAIALGWKFTLAPMLSAGLPFVTIARQGLQLFREQTDREPTISEWIAIASIPAYLESLYELTQSNDLLKLLPEIPSSEPIQKQIALLREFPLDEHLARNALSCFHSSELAQALNQLLSAQLQQAGISENEAQIVTAWVAWGTHRHLQQLVDYESGSLKQMIQIYGAGKGTETDKYESIEEYLNTQIKTKPEETVFAENFSFKDIYVPLKKKPVDKNGDVDKKANAIGLETWARDILNEPKKQGQVMFIQAGPGRGKSVFCRMFADWVRQHLHPLWTPILIRLRDIVKLQQSFRETLREAVPTNFATSGDWLADRNTRFLFLLDGFDELVMEGRSSGGLEEFLKQVGQFQQDCQRSKDMGHRVLITGRPLALQNLERFMPHNLERVEIQLMDEKLRQLWLSQWSQQVGEEKSNAFGQFLQDERIIKSVGELASEPLLLYLLAAMHRDGHLSVQKLEGTSGIETKILIYQESLRWVLEEQRPQWLNRQLTAMETAGLQRILAEAALCVVQSGRECAPLPMLKERIQVSDGAAGLIKQAEERLGDEALKNALAAFYLQPTHRDKGGSVEFAHKSFSEFLFAQLLAERLVEWTVPGRRDEEFLVSKAQMNWEIYDLLGYGGLTSEIVEYLMGLLTTPSTPLSKDKYKKKEEDKFEPVKLFQRLEKFYLRWCNGEFIDIPKETLPQKKTSQFKEHGINFGQRQVDVYAGLNVMILLLELHRYGQSKDDLKEEIAFYLCGQEDTEDFNPLRLLKVISYSQGIEFDSFRETVGPFLSGADLRGAYLRGAYLRGADLRGAYLRGAYLRGADLSGADLSGAYLRGADLSGADLSGADLSGADLSGADLSGADLRVADLSGADLSRAYLSGADLSRADLSRAYLSRAYLSRAYLSGADLSGADLSRAYLSGAYLSDEVFGDISWDEKTNWKDVRGLEEAINVPEALKQQLSILPQLPSQAEE
ncbi:MAG: NACHT domain-containing protein [Symploca sp. SIO2B6]|nr:NACHT domain-containing protein [Symploca sp. SIO2B6]